MTFIVAIQLNDSIIIASDNKKAVVTETGKIEISKQGISKLHIWENGISTGTGEYYVISRAVEFFKKLAHSNLNKLAKCLDVSKRLRILEIDEEYDQVHNAKLLCSSYSEHGAQLYKVECFDKKQEHVITALKPMEIIVWLFHPNADAIADDLQNLYIDLKDYSCFDNKVDWVNYYINRLAVIYQKQSLQDPFMSRSFDFFCQMKGEYILGHVPNTQHSAIEFSEI